MFMIQVLSLETMRAVAVLDHGSCTPEQLLDAPSPPVFPPPPLPSRRCSSDKPTALMPLSGLAGGPPPPTTFMPPFMQVSAFSCFCCVFRQKFTDLLTKIWENFGFSLLQQLMNALLLFRPSVSPPWTCTRRRWRR